MDPSELLTELRSIRQQQFDNHTEVVQRLTAIETASNGLPERVSALEGYKNKAVGVLAFLSVTFTVATNWLFRRVAH